jgi:hypothetical protein
MSEVLPEHAHLQATGALDELVTAALLGGRGELDRSHEPRDLDRRERGERRTDRGLQDRPDERVAQAEPGGQPDLGQVGPAERDRRAASTLSAWSTTRSVPRSWPSTRSWRAC